MYVTDVYDLFMIWRILLHWFHTNSKLVIDAADIISVISGALGLIIALHSSSLAHWQRGHLSEQLIATAEIEIIN